MNEEYRIVAMRNYLIKVLDDLLKSNSYMLNVDFLDTDEEYYSINRIPTEPQVNHWIVGVNTHQEIYEFFSKKNYSADVLENLNNIGFFEKLEKKIFENNQNKILPEINGIKSIECLTCGALESTTPNESTFSLQIKIEYYS